MGKLPIKYIYLLTVIVVGIVALSIYSTYAIFTFESETSNVVTMNTPNSINIDLSTSEYRRILIPANSYITTDVDLYNNFNYELCYSIWYSIIESNLVQENKIRIYQNTSEELSTSGIIGPIDKRRVSLIILNDNDIDVKVNIGVAYDKNSNTCELNINNDKHLITSFVSNPSKISDYAIKNNVVLENEEGYLVYKDNIDAIKLSNDKQIYVSNEFTYTNEMFTLKNATLMNVKDIGVQNYYTCFDNSECRELYQIKEISKEIIDEKDNYSIAKYDILVGYLSGKVGMRKIGNDYAYFGDNPNNFIYYNCLNDMDNRTCELWRIVGYIYDDDKNGYLTKIIRNESIGTYQFDSIDNTIKDSSVMDYLNKEYKIYDNSYVKEVNIVQENILDLSSKLDDRSILDFDDKAKVSIMSLSDYLRASVCEKDIILEYDNECMRNNWLNKNYDIDEYTTSIKYVLKTDEEEEIINNIVYVVGDSINEGKITDEYNIRPVVYLKSNLLLIDGDGTKDSPYIVR